MNAFLIGCLLNNLDTITLYEGYQSANIWEHIVNRVFHDNIIDQVLIP